MVSTEVHRSARFILRLQGLPILPFLAPSVPQVWLPVRTKSTKVGISALSTASLKREQSDQDAQSRYPHPPPNTRQDKTPQLETAVAKTLTATEERRNRGSGRPELRKQIDSYLDQMMRLDYPPTTVREAELPTRRKQGDILAGMAFLKSDTGAGSEQKTSELMEHIGKAEKNVNLNLNFRNQRTVQSRPSVGSTIELDPNRGVDFAKSLSYLGSRLAQNGVRSHRSKQKFHERPGMKRKRLRSVRWRRYFKAGFDATVTRVKQMRAQGW